MANVINKPMQRIKVPRIEHIKEYLKDGSLELYKQLKDDKESALRRLPFDRPGVAYDSVQDLFQKMGGYNNPDNPFAKVWREIGKEGNNRNALRAFVRENPKSYMALCEYIENRLRSTAYLSHQPTWMHISLEEPLKKQWLVHVTPIINVKKIKEQGFVKGITDTTRLAYTKVQKAEHKGPGYSFAYTLQELLQYDRPKIFIDSYIDTAAPAHAMVIFRAPGVKVYHEGDEEEQVIFRAEDATNLVAVKREYEVFLKKWRIDMSNGRSVYFKDWKQPLRWISSHYHQYRRLL